jgi:hypothetical protein
VVTHILNLPLSSFMISISWKPSIVTPIQKVRPPSSFDDLQPISVTLLLSKVFEKLFVSFCFVLHCQNIFI